MCSADDDCANSDLHLYHLTPYTFARAGLKAFCRGLQAWPHKCLVYFMERFQSRSPGTTSHAITVEGLMSVSFWRCPPVPASRCVCSDGMQIGRVVNRLSNDAANSASSDGDHSDRERVQWYLAPTDCPEFKVGSC